MGNNKNVLVDIQNMVCDIVKYDNIKNNNKSTCIEFNELQKVIIPNNGFIHSIDTNNMVLLEFEDTMGTTDWLPLDILKDDIINGLNDVITQLHKEMNIQKCYIIVNKWQMPCESGYDLVRTFNSLEKAKEYFLEYLTNEVLNTWLCDYVDENGNLYDENDDRVDEYDFSKSSSRFYLLVYCRYTEIYIEEQIIY